MGNEKKMSIVMDCAKMFREGIEKALDDLSKIDYKFRHFPIGCCGDSSDLLAQYFFDHNIPCYCVCGTYHYDQFDNIYSHEWLELGNEIIVDITSDQFNNNPIFSPLVNPDCYVGRVNSFYDLFINDINYREKFKGLRSFNGDYNRLKKLYHIINNYI